jgi:fructosamine-3-kinase
MRLASATPVKLQRTQDELRIPQLPVGSHLIKPVVALRLNAPSYVRSILTQSRKLASVLGDYRSVTIAPVKNGGNLSACYMLTTPTGRFLLKLRHAGLFAERTAMSQWRRSGASVAEVVSGGIVPSTRGSAQSVKYIVLELVLDSSGEAAQTGTDFVKTNHHRTKSIGYQMGAELAQMHRASTTKTFGEFGDMWGKSAPYGTMNSFLSSHIDNSEALLTQMGYNRQLLKRLHTEISKIRFVKHGRYLHGDYSLRNILIARSRPLKIVVIDPNPLIGDPSWDLAVLYNNVDFARRQLAHQPGTAKTKRLYELERDCLAGLIQGYQDTTRHRINPVKVKACQLIQAMFLLEIQVAKAKRRHKKPSTQMEVIARQEAIREHINDFINVMP